MFDKIIKIFNQLWFDTPFYLFGISFFIFFLIRGFAFLLRCFWDSYGNYFVKNTPDTELIECAEKLSFISEQLDILTVQESNAAPRIVPVNITTKYVKCRYCDSMFESGILVCVNCGGSLEHLEV